jgi:hypothetical protein
MLLLGAACTDRPNAPSPVPNPSSAPLTIASLSPTEGVAGQRLIVSGNGFNAGTTLTLGGLPAENVTVGAGTLGGTIPSHPGGPVDIVVTNPDGRSATRTGGFTYVTVSLTVTPNPVRPGEPLAVSWDAAGWRARGDWIGLFDVGSSNDGYQDGFWQYTNSASGTMTFTAPGRAGDYEFGYLLDDGFVVVNVARAAVAVR